MPRVKYPVWRTAVTTFYPQSKYLLNLAYLRLKNLTLGYSFSPELLKRIHLQKLRVYVSGQNIADIIIM